MFDCIFVTGGAGFIGSNFVLQSICQTGGKIINYDKLTYAGNLKNLVGLQNDPRHVFVRGDVNDARLWRRPWPNISRRPSFTSRLKVMLTAPSLVRKSS